MGTLSPDGAAIVGTEGRLYIAHGANDFVRQYRGELPLRPRVSATGRAPGPLRNAQRTLGVPLACLVVPDKLAIDPEATPTLSTRCGAPDRQLLEVRRGALLYPLDSCAADCSSSPSRCRRTRT